MQNNQLSDRLSWGDSVFLNLERDGMPLNVASVSILEGDIPFDTFLRFVESKLPQIPRYLKRVTSPPLDLGLPSWDYDQHFDIHNHLHGVTLKNGSDAELKSLAGNIFSKVMDRRHPLWDMTLVHGLKGDRSALIARIHHCLADGIAGVGIMGAFMDATPAVPKLPKRKPRLRIPPPQDPVRLLVEGMANSYSAMVDRVFSAWKEALTLTEQAITKGKKVTDDEFSHLLPELTAPTERLSFNTIYHGPQKFEWTEISLEEVKTIRRTFGTTVNDVLLALITGTIRRYSELHGDRIKDRLLRIMVPVNRRENGSPSGLGNQISIVPVTIPLDVADPRELLEAVHTRTEFLKRSHAADLVGLAGGLFGMLPNPMQVLAGPLISRLPITPFNMVCTNVPGPQFPLYLLGHKMLHWYPYVPVGGELAINCAVLSYNGMVYFGFSGDAKVASDLAQLDKFLKLSFAELLAATGIKHTTKKRVRTKKSVSSREHSESITTTPAASSEGTPEPDSPQVVCSLAEPTTTPDQTVNDENPLSQPVA